MKIPLGKPVITRKMLNAAMGVLRSGIYIKGPCVEKFEAYFSKYCGTKFGVATSNGTAAIYIALRALDIKSGDEVIVPSHSFVASASPILMCGARPVFVDVDDTYTIDTNDLKSKITSKTKAIMAVHLYGQMCDMDELVEIREREGIYLIEDGAQAHGAEYNGNKAGSYGDISCFSFFPAKNMTVGGDGGMAITNDGELSAKMCMLRDHGRDYNKKDGKYRSELLTLNFRMNEIMAAIGAEQLKRLDSWNLKRRKIAKVYTQSLTGKITKPLQAEGRKHVFHLYVIRTNERDKLKDFLSRNDIQTGIHYPVPIHKQPIFEQFAGRLPNTEVFCKKILSLPIHPLLSLEETEKVAVVVNSYFKG